MAKNQAKNIPQQKTAQPIAKPVSKPKTTTSSGSWLPVSQNKELLFDKTNYLILAAGAFLIILGFILMSGGNTDPNVFNKEEIYSARRITVAPITIIAGFLVIVVAILKKPADKQVIG